MRNTMLILTALLCAGPAGATAIELAARHERGGRNCAGTLRFEDSQARWTPAKPSRRCRDLAWPYAEMQRLEMEDRRIVITGYTDRRWRLGADAHWNFRLAAPAGDALYAFLRTKMDSRFAPRYAEKLASLEWSVAAKMFSGSFPSGNWGGEGTLEIGPDRIVFRSTKPGYSRTWLDSEIDNVAVDPPFLLTLAVREGGRSVLRTFQLKRELDNEKFDTLWRRLNRPRGLQLLTDLEEHHR